MAKENLPLVERQRFEVELDCFFDVRDGFFKRAALRLASLQFRAPSVKAMLVLFNHYARFTGHRFSVSPLPMPSAFLSTYVMRGR